KEINDCATKVAVAGDNVVSLDKATNEFSRLLRSSCKVLLPLLPLSLEADEEPHPEEEAVFNTLDNCVISNKACAEFCDDTADPNNELDTFATYPHGSVRAAVGC